MLQAVGKEQVGPVTGITVDFLLPSGSLAFSWCGMHVQWTIYIYFCYGNRHADGHHIDVQPPRIPYHVTANDLLATYMKWT